MRETDSAWTVPGAHGPTSTPLLYEELAYRWPLMSRPSSDWTYLVDLAYLLREGGETSVVQDRHVEGVFATEQWADLLGTVGFEWRKITHRFSDTAHDTVVFVGIRPESA